MAKGSAMGSPSGGDRPASAGLEVGWDSVPWGWTAQSRAVPRKAARARAPGHGGREVAFLTGAGLRRTHFLRTAGRPALRPPQSRLPGGVRSCSREKCQTPNAGKVCSSE